MKHVWCWQHVVTITTQIGPPEPRVAETRTRSKMGQPMLRAILHKDYEKVRKYTNSCTVDLCLSMACDQDPPKPTSDKSLTYSYFWGGGLAPLSSSMQASFHMKEQCTPTCQAYMSGGLHLLQNGTAIWRSVCSLPFPFLPCLTIGAAIYRSLEGLRVRNPQKVSKRCSRASRPGVSKKCRKSPRTLIL